MNTLVGKLLQFSSEVEFLMDVLYFKTKIYKWERKKILPVEVCNNARCISAFLSLVNYVYSYRQGNQ